MMIPYLLQLHLQDSRNFPKPLSLFCLRCVSSTLEKDNFLYLKLQIPQQSSMIYHINRAFIFSHSMLVRVTISCTLKFSAHFPEFRTYNRIQDF